MQNAVFAWQWLVERVRTFSSNRVVEISSCLSAHFPRPNWAWDVQVCSYVRIVKVLYKRSSEQTRGHVVFRSKSVPWCNFFCRKKRLLSSLKLWVRVSTVANSEDVIRVNKSGVCVNRIKQVFAVLCPFGVRWSWKITVCSLELVEQSLIIKRVPVRHFYERVDSVEIPTSQAVAY